MLVNPIGFKKAMLDAKHEYEEDMEGVGPGPGPPIRDGLATGTGEPAPTSRGRRDRGAPSRRRPPAPAGGRRQPRRAGSPSDPDEVTRTLANLADLRDRGAITPEEYEAKKADLLGRL